MGKLDAIINDLIREIWSKYDWTFSHSRQILTTSASITTGTVEVTKSSTSITFSSAPVDSVDQWILLIDGNEVENALFRIGDHTAGATAATLESPYTGTTNPTTAYKLYKDEFDLNSDVAKVLFVQRYGYPHPLHKLNWTEMLQIKGYDRSEGPPQIWAVNDFNDSGDPTTQKQLLIHPFPDDTYQLEVHHKKTLDTEYAGSSQLPIPDDYLHLIEWGVLAHAYPIFLNDAQRGSYYMTRYVDSLNLAVAQFRDEEGGQPQTIPQDMYRSFYRKGRRANPALVDLGNWFGRLPYNP